MQTEEKNNETRGRSERIHCLQKYLSPYKFVIWILYDYMNFYKIIHKNECFTM